MTATQTYPFWTKISVKAMNYEIAVAMLYSIL